MKFLRSMTAEDKLVIVSMLITFGGIILGAILKRTEIIRIYSNPGDRNPYYRDLRHKKSAAFLVTCIWLHSRYPGVMGRLDSRGKLAFTRLYRLLWF